MSATHNPATELAVTTTATATTLAALNLYSKLSKALAGGPTASPLMLIFWLARHEIQDQRYRNPGNSIQRPRRLVSPAHKIYMCVAAAGLFCVVGSQTNATPGTERLISYEAVAGALIATAGAALVALNVLATIVYGKVLYYRLGSGVPPDPSTTIRSIRDRGADHIKLLAWLTILAFIPVRVVSIPVNLAAGLLLSGTAHDLSAAHLGGAALMGVVITVAVILLRVGNVAATNPGVNILFLLSPALAQGLLLVVGVGVAHVGLYVTGAAMIIAANILAQAHPRSSRPAARPV